MHAAREIADDTCRCVVLECNNNDVSRISHIRRGRLVLELSQAAAQHSVDRLESLNIGGVDAGQIFKVHLQLHDATVQTIHHFCKGFGARSMQLLQYNTILSRLPYHMNWTTDLLWCMSLAAPWRIFKDVQICLWGGTKKGGNWEVIRPSTLLHLSTKQSWETSLDQVYAPQNLNKWILKMEIWSHVTKRQPLNSYHESKPREVAIEDNRKPCI